MFFDTIEEYNIELKEIQNILKKMEKSIEDYPEQWGTKINYDGLKYVYNIILNDREEFLKMKEENLNLHIKGKLVENQAISSSILSELIDDFNQLSINIKEYLKNDVDFEFKNHDLDVNSLKGGSIQISFSMNNNINDLTEVLITHQAFERLFELINCDLEKLYFQKEIIGVQSIIKYVEFLKIIIDNELDFSLEDSSKKVGLSYDESVKVFEKLKDDV